MIPFFLALAHAVAFLAAYAAAAFAILAGAVVLLAVARRFA